MSAGVNSRRAALFLVEAVLDRDRTLDEACAQTKPYKALEPRDRAFARLTALTTLRRIGQIDALIDGWLDRPPKGKARRALSILRIGLAQLLFLDTPPHAATDALVELAKADGLAAQAGLINAVMRRAARAGAMSLATQDAARMNTPDWLWRDWVAQFGEPTSRAIADAGLREPPVDITIRPRAGIEADIGADTWAERLGGVRIGENTVRLEKPGDVTALEGFAEGAWWVQDAAAAIPATLLGNIAGKRVIDLCAAPGGKTAQLLAAGAIVTAVDRSKPRMDRLRENLNRLGLVAEIVAADAGVWRPDVLAEGILLDAPCGATGTLRRHPEIARRRGAEDIAKLSTLQHRLTEAAIEMMAPGALLVIATCSLQSQEGPELAEYAAGLAGLRIDPIQPDETPFGDIIDGCLRTHPGHLADQGSVDGFFVSRFRRV